MSAVESHRRIPFETLDVFTSSRFGGNQLAVFTDARGLTDAEMQSLAAEMNLSETTFVLPPENSANSARVRIFHRTAEMPFAGHPTLGTGVLLARLGHPHGDSLRLEVPAGIVRVQIHRDETGCAVGGTILAPQPLQRGEAVNTHLVAACVTLAAADIVTAHHQPLIASVGATYLIAEVSAAAIVRASPDLTAFRASIATMPHLDGRLSLLIYARRDEHIHARMFAPLAGTWEDPATGSANAALAALLLSLSDQRSATFHVQQGVEMRRPSALRVTAARTADGIRATVSGRCVQVLAGFARI